MKIVMRKIEDCHIEDIERKIRMKITDYEHRRL